MYTVHRSYDLTIQILIAYRKILFNFQIILTDCLQRLTDHVINRKHVRQRASSFS